MQLQRFTLSLFAVVTTLTGCERVDTLSVKYNHDHTAVIVDEMAGNDRIVCVLPDATKPCSRGSSQIIVTGAGSPAEIDTAWTSPHLVNIIINKGRLTKSKAKALGGRVRIAYR